MILIFDGNFILHRILRTPGFLSQDNGGVNGVLATINKVTNLFQAATTEKIFRIFSWDGGKSKRRIEIFQDYKYKKDYTEDDKKYFEIFNEQKSILERRILPDLGILSVCIQNKEGDDIIYTLCSILKDKRKSVISEDKDMLQLIAHFNDITIYQPIKDRIINSSNFQEIIGVPAKGYLYYKAAIGDSSDNIKGVKGVGPKTMVEVLNKVDCENLPESLFKYSQSEEYKRGGVRQARLFSQWDILIRNMELMDLSREVFSNNLIKNLTDNLNLIIG